MVVCGWVLARGGGLVTGQLQSSAPATVGEELLQHLIVHLEEFDRGVGERVGKLKRRRFWLCRLGRSSGAGSGSWCHGKDRRELL